MWYDTYTILRHVVELLSAHLIFFFPAAKKRSRFWIRFSIGLVALCVIVVPLYFLVIFINAEFKTALSWSVGMIFSGQTINYYIYYILIDIVLILIFLHFCFKVPPDTLFFLSLAARTVDLTKGVIFYLVEFNFFGSMNQNDLVTTIVYGSLRTLIVAVYLLSIYLLVGRRWRPGDNMQLINRRMSCFVYLLMIFVMFITNTLVTLLIYIIDVSIKYIGIVIEAMFGIFVFITLITIQLNNKQKMEKHIIYNMLQERGKQYLTSKENMEIINQKYHDLKHQISALKAIESTAGKNSIKELDDSLTLYDSMIKTGNEILDTLLTEKSLYFAQKNIQFNYNVDSTNMEFLDAVDLYTMLGNALDNASEAVESLSDKSKHLINLSIENNGVMVMIQIYNYCKPELKLSGEMPKTTKDDGSFHGFGIKSIKSIAQKYKGDIRIDVNKGIFTLTIGIPVPLPPPEKYV